MRRPVLVRRRRTIPRATGRSARGRSRRCRGAAARPATSGCSFTPTMADDRLAEQQRRPHARVRPSTTAPRPCVTETTTSIASSRAPGGTSSASTSRSTGAPGSCAEHDRLVGLVQAHVHEHRVDLEAGVGGDRPRPRARTSSAVSGSSGCGRPVIQPPVRLLLAHVLGGAGDEALDVVRLPGDEVLEVLGDVHLERAAVERVERRRDELADGDELDRRGERVVVGHLEERRVDHARVHDQHLDAGVPEVDRHRLGEHRRAPTSTRRTPPRPETTASPPPTTR